MRHCDTVASTRLRLHHKTTEAQPCIHHTSWTTPSVIVARSLSVHVHAKGSKIRGRNFKHFKTTVGRVTIRTVGQ